jgi:hypothetical protein
MTTAATSLALLLVLAACEGGSATGPPTGDGAGSITTSGDSASIPSAGNGSLLDPQPPGQAKVVLDGQEYTFTEPGASACSIGAESITFSFRIGDNEITVGGGANLYDDGWLGSIDLIVWNPDGEDTPIDYSPALADNGDGLVIDGKSMSYSGPWTRNDPSDPSNIDGVSAGDGSLSFTCR